MAALRGKNLEDVQAMNRELILRYLLGVDISSRTSLAQKSHLKQATLTNIINDFIQWGLVEETGLINKGVGRPTIGIRLRKEKYRVVCVRLSRNYVEMAVIDLDRKIYFEDRFDVDSRRELATTVELMIGRIRGILGRFGGESFLGIGVAMPGPWVKDQQRLAYFTGFYQWKDLDIGKIMEEALGLPVFVEQDANAALMAEREFHSWAQNDELVLLVMVGQGIGAGIYSNGQILRGKLGIAGEIGHMSIDYAGIACECGNVGCLERYASTSAVVDAARRRLGEGARSALGPGCRIAEVAEAYKAGDGLAAEVVDEAACYLGYALASLTNVLNPGVIIIGDELAAAGPRYLAAVKKAMAERVTPTVRDSTEVALSSVSENPFLLGIGQAAIEGCIKDPEAFFAPGRKSERS
jgi:predicted NBD/HSP70 family sugar kinase